MSTNLNINHFDINKMSCSNCRESGHTHKSCIKPISSFGIICFRITDDGIKYLLIQRKHSISYIDFIRGKYSFDNINFLNLLFRKMTDNEKQKLISIDFDKIWDDLWINNTESHSYRNEYKFSSKKFEIIKNGLINDSGIYIRLNMLVCDSTTQYPDLEWGFPKGRRNKEESDLHCAIREFGEETNYQREEYTILEDIEPFDEEFIGTNSTAYRYVYYVCRCKSDREAEIDLENKNQISEIGNLGWFHVEDAKKLIGNTCIKRMNVLTKLHEILTEKYKSFFKKFD